MNLSRVIVGALLTSLAFLGAGCGGPRGPGLLALDGKRYHPLERAAGAVHVIVFVSHECPIANAYAPTLRALAAAWANQPVALYLVHCDPDLSLAAAKQHAAEFELAGTVLLDPRHELAKELGATRTPEAFVVCDQGTAYHGRIDDQWAALGSRAQEVGCHDLRDAVAVVLAGKAVANSVTDAVGCLLPEPKR
ncbi:MAG: redoxin domain-containing protein [Planctomycetes bacterium]|nr:redoxin domain-containing protein [Planctomycetota bacterium]